MVWLNSHEQPGRDEAVAQSWVAAAAVSGAPATPRARTRTALVSTAATSSPKANERTARAV